VLELELELELGNLCNLDDMMMATATRWWQQWRGAEGADEARKSGCFSCCYLVSVCTAPGLGACLAGGRHSGSQQTS
jgi:hypothetical protein